MDEFLDLLKSKLKYAGMDDMPSDDILISEISDAIGEINRRRNHIYSDENPVEISYARFVVPLAMSAILKTGAEGQNSHSENGVSRGYSTDGMYPRDMLRQITWVVR